MLVNIFQFVLHLCIDEGQSAFVLGRLITDNILAVYEVLHSFKNRRVGHRGSFALKLDMSKVDDRVECQFIETLLRKISFSNRWIQCIMGCVMSVSYLVVLNDVVDDNFLPSCRLRQSDPSTSLNERIARSVSLIKHLFFVDYSLIFGEANCNTQLLLPTQNLRKLGLNWKD
ncbi:reverse transcriptase [Gossypium australe]|uniref:Reverse transcriptase n=1 Tax=Gossypium australe TaxID=47621 RepID=A0A5B6X2V4_9ROSI|nr:reverse transcriptase [Gossypium australe]